MIKDKEKRLDASSHGSQGFCEKSHCALAHCAAAECASGP